MLNYYVYLTTFLYGKMLTYKRVEEIKGAKQHRSKRIIQVDGNKFCAGKEWEPYASSSGGS